MLTLSIASPLAVAQTPPYSPPRTSDGKPDLTGVWRNPEVPLERPDGVTALVISREAYDAAKKAKRAPSIQTVNGELRTSAIVSPQDGRLPYRDRKSALAWREKYGTYMTGAPMPDFTADVDALPNRDRCLMAANAAAPPMTSQGYNDAYQIVQTPTHVVIDVEMMNEVRIILVVANAVEAAKAHRPKALPRWTGDSVGWWEGDTFVVETWNVDQRQGDQSPTPTTVNAHFIERFTRVAEDEIVIRTEVIDPALYSQSWTTELSFVPTQRVWEYACHEGNYGLANILSGARRTERDKARRNR